MQLKIQLRIPILVLTVLLFSAGCPTIDMSGMYEGGGDPCYERPIVVLQTSFPWPWLTSVVGLGSAMCERLEGPGRIMDDNRAVFDLSSPWGGTIHFDCQGFDDGSAPPGSGQGEIPDDGKADRLVCTMDAPGSHRTFEVWQIPV